MIVYFAIDTDALERSSSDLVSQLAAHSRIISLWRDVGVLVYDGSNLIESEFVAAVNQLPQPLKVRWQQALKHQRKLAAGKGQVRLCTMTEPNELVSLQGRVDVACLEETRALCLGLPEGNTSIRCKHSGLELCRFDVADQCESFKNARELSLADIVKGKKIDALWRERFDRLASLCHTGVTVVDRYAMDSHRNRNDGYSGLRKLLVELDRKSRGIGVYIYSAVQVVSHNDLVSSLESLVKSLNGTGIRNVTLYLGDDREFGRIAHHRYLRFDDAICDIDVGLEVFAGESVYRNCIFKLKQKSESIEQIECDLRSLCTKYPIR